jgi:Spy/CpxP family protein refolding chaperone
MKKLALLLLLVVASGLATGAFYVRVRPQKSPEACTMTWLGEQLSLSETQYEKIWALHCRYCPQIERASPSQCRTETEALIAAVSAELTPAQREKYRELVAPCLAPRAPAVQ